MEQQGWLCDSCTQVAAVMFCSCQGHETFLCEGCYISHYRKNLTQIHLALPLSEYGRKRPLGYLERLQVRFINFPIAKEGLRKCLQAIDACIADLMIETEKVINAVRDFSSATVFQLQGLRSSVERDISEGCAEVDATMHEDAPIIQSELAKQIRSFTGDFGSLRHFTFNINSSLILNDIKSLCVYSVATPIENSFLLPGINQGKLFVYDVQTSVKSIYPLSSALSSGYQLAFIERDALLAVGSVPISPKAYIIKVPSGVITETRQMRFPRQNPGLIVVGKFAYVFGGWCKNCEKYQISDYAWTNLPDMKKEKTGFSPCLYENCIYLFRAHDNFEVFDLSSDNFRSIIINKSIQNHYSISVVSGNEIITLSCSGEIVRWQIESAWASVNPIEQFKEVNAPLSQCNPILKGKEIYYVNKSFGGVFSFNLDIKKCIEVLD